MPRIVVFSWSPHLPILLLPWWLYLYYYLDVFHTHFLSLFVCKRFVLFFVVVKLWNTEIHLKLKIYLIFRLSTWQNNFFKSINNRINGCKWYFKQHARDYCTLGQCLKILKTNQRFTTIMHHEWEWNSFQHFWRHSPL